MINGRRTSTDVINAYIEPILRLQQAGIFETLLQSHTIKVQYWREVI